MRIARAWALRIVGVLSIFVIPQVLHAQVPRGPELLLFGGKDHKEFLGCVNCSSYDGGSICNRYGEQGSRYASNSIWNRYGEYGSKYSDLSPWNKYASFPPVIVDRDGAFYGSFTAARSDPQRTRIPALRELLDAADEVVADPQEASDIFCGRK